MKVVSAVVRQLTGPQDCMGGDGRLEVALLLFRDPMGVTPQLRREQLLAGDTLPMDLDGHRINPHAYVGMGTFPDDGQRPLKLLMAAARSADVGTKLHLVRPPAHRKATG